MKLITLISALFLFLPASTNAQQQEIKHRYYFNPVYTQKEFKETWSDTFKALPSVTKSQALEKAKTNKDVITLLKSDPNYILISLEDSYTDDNGKTWTNWEIGIARPSMNQTLRIDAVFGVNPISGKIKRLQKPIIHMPIKM